MVFFAGCPPAPASWLVAACILTGFMAAHPAPTPGARHARSPVTRCVRAARTAAALWLSWVALVAMAAALAQLFTPLAPWPPGALGLAAAALWAGASMPAGQGLARISGAMGPFIAAAVAGLALWAAAAPPPGWWEPGSQAPPPSVPDPMASRGAARCAAQATLYAASNGLFARGPLLAVARGAVHGSLLASAVAGGLLLAATGASALWLIDRARTAPLPMPLVSAAAALHPAAHGIQLAVVVASVYTTGVAAAVGLSGWATSCMCATGRLEAVARKGFTAFWILGAMPAASLGFAEAVQKLYPLAGWVALAAVGLEALFARLAGRCLY